MLDTHMKEIIAVRCPCRKKPELTTYADCCEPYHRDMDVPPTAGSLMRSRYSAISLQKSETDPELPSCRCATLMRHSAGWITICCALQ